jgi:hypothetical protein
MSKPVRMSSALKNGPMDFEELDNRLRLFETAHDHPVLPGLFMVARLDGRRLHSDHQGLDFEESQLILFQTHVEGREGTGPLTARQPADITTRCHIQPAGGT